jgi:hypothetical protein
VQEKELFCKLYVAGAADEDALSAVADQIARACQAADAGSAGLSALDIYVHAQSRHLPLDDAQDDFTLWRHYMDIEAADAKASFEVFIVESAQLVAGLRARGFKVVVACMFEQALEAAARG